MSQPKGGLCDICGRGPFARVVRHKTHKHPEWEAPHGSLTRFTQSKCRCQECREAYTEWSRGRAKVIAIGEALCPDCDFRSSPQGVVRHRNLRHGLVHGLASSYTRGCRCEGCRAARARWQREKQADRGERKRGDEACHLCDESGFANIATHLRTRHGIDTTPPHGTPSRYAYRCRCEPCRAAASRARAEARQKALRRSGRPLYGCEDCGKVFRSDAARASHEIREHGHSDVRQDATCLRRMASNGGHAHVTVCREDADDAIKKLLTNFTAVQLLIALAKAAKR